MYIVFGTRASFRSNQVSQFGFCGHCDQFNKLKSYHASNCFHVYYIPLIPVQGRRRYHRVCSKCNQGTVFEVEKYQQWIEAFQEKAADAIVAVQNGESVLSPEEPDSIPVECVPFLHGLFEAIYASGGADFCHGMVNRLTDENCRYAREMLDAALKSMSGKLDDAIQGYATASNADPKAPEPHQQRAHLLVVQKRISDAVQAYQTALALTSDPSAQFAIRWQMLDHQMALKQFSEASKSVDQILAIRPDLATNAAFAKKVKKIKKQAGA